MYFIIFQFICTVCSNNFLFDLYLFIFLITIVNLFNFYFSINRITGEVLLTIDFKNIEVVTDSYFELKNSRTEDLVVVVTDTSAVYREFIYFTIVIFSLISFCIKSNSWIKMQFKSVAL